MYKKRGDFARRGQITMFIIIGIVILFAVTFLLVLFSKAQQNLYEETQSNAFEQLFGREPLKIYIDDCLQDEFVAGLKLLGKQGRIWEHQGGRTVFLEGENGILLEDIEPEAIKVAFGISFDGHENYPCKGEDKCTYSFPNTTLSFGKKEIRMTTLEKDLGAYLYSKVVECTHSELLGRSAENLQLNSDAAKFKVKFSDNTVDVDVNFPLQIGGDNAPIALSKFGFQYPTTVKQLLDVAVVQPIDFDVQYVDYNYFATPYVIPGFDASLGENKLKYASPVEEPCWPTSQGEHCPCENIDGTIICTNSLDNTVYEAQGIQFGRYSLDDVDIFEFAPTYVGELEDFVFRFARQNRPPALDYISQCPREGYDYLYVPGAQGPLGEVKIPANSAHDPDEDATLSYVANADPITNPNEDYLITLPSDFTVSVSDGHLSDTQDVIVREGDFAQPTYIFTNLVDESNIVSLEDPVCVSIDAPTVEGIDIDVELRDNNVPTNRDFALHDGSVDLYPECDLSNFGNIETIKDNLASYFSDGKYTSPLGGSISYGEGASCEYALASQVEVQTQKCTEFDGVEGHPLPYVPGKNYHNLKLVDGVFEPDPIGSPFKAPNLCCDAGTLKSFDFECWNQEGCFENNLVLNKSMATCGDTPEAVRGNICGGTRKMEPYEVGKVICGDPGLKHLGCKASIPSLCSRKEAYSLVKENEDDDDYAGWCTGDQGCESLCGAREGDEIVMPDSEDIDRVWDRIDQIQNPSQAPNFRCGCETVEEGATCDDNFDGVFDKRCDSSNRCTIEIS